MNHTHAILAQLRDGAPLTEVQAEDAFERLLTGAFDEAQISAFLSLIAVRGPTVDELVGGARVMRRHVRPVPIPDFGPDRPTIIDTCGTGGAPKAFNISTAGAIITAAAGKAREAERGGRGEGGVAVAKHGSTSRTGRGSAEVLEKLGVNVAASPEVQARCLREIGVCFSFAVHHHPAMKHAAAPRKSLGFPTIFNLLGPLTNPAGARRQLMGTYAQDVAEKLAATLARLGTERTIVFTTRDGLDELTTTGVNVLHRVEGGTITHAEFDARSLGLAPARFEDLQVADLDEAARAVDEAVRGVPGPRFDVVLLNAAASLVVGGAAEELPQGLKLARRAVETGLARRTLERLRDLSQQQP